jgi:lambda family phage portal protein
LSAILDQHGKPMAFGGGITGADRTTREMASWTPDLRPADVRLANGTKDLLDGRVRDQVTNDGFVASATDLTKDSIVGAQYVLNARPNATALEAPEGWAEEFQLLAETRFNLLADSEKCWFDTQRTKSLTDLVRLGLTSSMVTGEILSVAEWVREAGRPCATAITLLPPGRLCNPLDAADTLTIRGGVELHPRWGYPIRYHLRNGQRLDPYTGSETWKWTAVDAALPWGRQQVLHAFEETEPGMHRGISQVTSVLKEMKMTKQYRDVVLQNAVTNAMYAAAIESELPPEVVFASLGGGNGGEVTPMDRYMGGLAEYATNARALQLDGVKIPHLYPGTKLKFYPAGQVGDTQFEARMLRHIASAFGLSYEEFSRDFTNTNYSSARASMAQSWRHMTSKKRRTADRIANFAYSLWLEEEISRGDLPMPPGRDRSDFYAPGRRDAYCAAEWIGAARGQIDEGKETDAAIARIDKGLSTYEDECARLGKDWRKVMRQRGRERRVMADNDLADLDAPIRPGTPGPKPAVSSGAP